MRQIVMALAVVMLAVLASGGVVEARTLGPIPEYTEAEVRQYWAGAVAQIGMKVCGYYSEGKALKDIVKQYEPAKYGLQQWGRNQYGGSCAEIKTYINKYLTYFGTDRVQLHQPLQV